LQSEEKLESFMQMDSSSSEFEEDTDSESEEMTPNEGPNALLEEEDGLDNAMFNMPAASAPSPSESPKKEKTKRYRKPQWHDGSWKIEEMDGMIRQYESLSFVGSAYLAQERKSKATEHVGEGILVNCCCPGPVRMHIASADNNEAERLMIEEAAAETPIFLATLPWGYTTGGKFWRDKAIIPWDVDLNEVTRETSMGGGGLSSLLGRTKSLASPRMGASDADERPSRPSSRASNASAMTHNTSMTRTTGLTRTQTGL